MHAIRRSSPLPFAPPPGEPGDEANIDVYLHACHTMQMLFVMQVVVCQSFNGPRAINMQNVCQINMQDMCHLLRVETSIHSYM